MDEARQEYKKVKKALETAQVDLMNLNERYKGVNRKIYNLEENIQGVGREKEITLVNLAKGELEESIENFEMAQFDIAIDKLKKEKRESEEFHSTIARLTKELENKKIPDLMREVNNKRHKLGQIIKQEMTEDIQSVVGDRIKMLWGVCSVTAGGAYPDLLLLDLFQQPNPEEMRFYHEKAWEMLGVEN